MMSAVSSGDVPVMEEGVGEIDVAAELGFVAAQSVLGFLHGMGIGKERDKAKGFLYHHFAAHGGNMQSKMALAYAYMRQDVCHNVTNIAIFCHIVIGNVGFFFVTHGVNLIDF